jgi:hypothetical protein
MIIFQIHSINGNTGGFFDDSNGLGDIPRTPRMYASIEAHLNIKCGKHNNLQQQLRLKTEARSHDYHEAVKQAVQNMISHKYSREIGIYAPRCKCPPGFSNIQYHFSNLEEPWKELFTSLFTASNWTIQKLIEKQASKFPALVKGPSLLTW